MAAMDFGQTRNLRALQYRIHKHERIVTLLGALIVFVTFVVKDAVKERVKEELDAITAAETAFLIHKDIQLAGAQAELIDQAIFAREQKMERQEKDPEQDTKKFIHDMGVLSKEISNVSSIYLVSSEVLDAAPNQSLRGRLNTIYHSLPVKEYSGQKFVDALNNMQLNKAELDKALLPVLVQQTEVEDNISHLSEEIHQHAIHERRMAQEDYLVWNKLSYVLYTVGWAFTLIGRISGVEGTGGAA